MCMDDVHGQMLVDFSAMAISLREIETDRLQVDETQHLIMLLTDFWSQKGAVYLFISNGYAYLYDCLH